MSRDTSRFQAITRREFTVESILAMLAGVTIVVSGCGSTSSSTPTSPSAAAPASGSGDVNGVISANHGHIATVTSAMITSPSSVSLNIQGTATHNHVVSLTAAQIQSIGNRQQVAVQSTVDSGHQHTVTVN